MLHRSYPPLWRALEGSVWRPRRVDPRPRELSSRPAFRRLQYAENGASNDAFRSEDCPVSTRGRPASKHCLTPCGCLSAKGSRRGGGIPLVTRRNGSLDPRCRVSLLIEPPNGDPFLPSFHTSTNV